MIWPHSRGFLQWKEHICVFTCTFSWLIRPAAVKKLQGKVSWHGAKAATLQKGQGLQRQVHQLHVCQQDQVVLCFCGRWHAERSNQSLILYSQQLPRGEGGGACTLNANMITVAQMRITAQQVCLIWYQRLGQWPRGCRTQANLYLGCFSASLWFWSTQEMLMSHPGAYERK